MTLRWIFSAAIGLLVLLAGSARAGIPADITLEPAFGGAGFSTPVALRHAGDDSGRKFVVERAGTIQVVDDTGTKLATPFLDISGQVSTTGEGGLLGLAFHPDYTTNGRFFVNYTYETGAGLFTRIAEFSVDGGDPDQADPASEAVVLEIPQDFSNHNAGDLHFGPDGYLWIAMGDGGSGNDPCNRAQTLDPDNLVDSCGDHPTTAVKALLGKMLRIDIDQVTPPGVNDLCGAAADGSAPYAVPADNPFVVGLHRDRFALPQQSVGVTEGPCPETWAYGFRNPYRFSFDRATGDLWIGDVGQNTWEEIDFIPAGTGAGGNFGWKICEGSFERGSTTDPCPLADHEGPVFEYENAGSECSVTGGFRYRGPVTSLQGIYVLGDFCSGRIWFTEDNGGFSTQEFGSAGGNIFGFGEDEAGELYLLRGSDIRIFDGNRD